MLGCVLDEPMLLLAGWLTVADVLGAPITVTGPTYRRIENHQLGINDLRTISSLRELLAAA